MSTQKHILTSVIFILITLLKSHAWGSASSDLVEEQGYNVVFLYYKKDGKPLLDGFRQAAVPTWKKYDVHISDTFYPTGEKSALKGANNMPVPDEVQIFYLENPDDIQLYIEDETYKKLSPIRAAGLERMIVFAGTSAKRSATVMENRGKHSVLSMQYATTSEGASINLTDFESNPNLGFVLNTQYAVAVVGENFIEMPSQILIHSNSMEANIENERVKEAYLFTLERADYTFHSN